MTASERKSTTVKETKVYSFIETISHYPCWGMKKEIRKSISNL